MFKDSKPVRSASTTTSSENNITKKISQYVVVRQNPDGGFSYARGLESNGLDTYCSLTILKGLDVPLPHASLTRRWLRSRRLYSILALFYTASALTMFGAPLPSETGPMLQKYDREKAQLQRGFNGIHDFLKLHAFILLSKTFGYPLDHQQIAATLHDQQNPDGGFGSRNHSDLRSTAYAVSLLSHIGCLVPRRSAVIAFTRSCEKKIGGFTLLPNNAAPTVEDTLAGLSLLVLSGESPAYRAETIRHILHCQNANGGFNRSGLGIATLEDTLFAVRSLQLLNHVPTPKSPFNSNILM